MVENAEEDDERFCDICMFTIKETVLPCLHAFCRDCIDAWLQKEGNCPMCRTERGSIESYSLMNERDSETIEHIKNDLVKELTEIINIIVKESTVETF